MDATGRWLVTASHDKTARIWNLASGQLERILRPPIGEDQEGELYTTALSPDGKTVAVGGWTRAGTGSPNIYLFDRATGEIRHHIDGLPHRIGHLAFAPDGTRLAVALGAGEGIRVYRTSATGTMAQAAIGSISTTGIDWSPAVWTASSGSMTPNCGRLPSGRPPAGSGPLP